jgi:CRP/FNR family transcriptional regulator, anaerobic regulatory protein
MRIVGVRNSPVGSGRAAAQRQSRPDSAIEDSKNNFRPPLYARPSERQPIPLDEKAAAQDSAPGFSDEGDVRFLAANKLLFGVGEPKSKLYVVETGALAVYEPRWNGHRAVIEFAFPGDVVGLGFLNTHACSARATTDTRVRCLPLSAQDRLKAGDARTQSRLADAIEREIEFLRESSVRFSRQNPLGRLAAFLLTLSRENEQEGRDPTVLAQPLDCGVVADFLALSIERLGSLLVELERRGLIEPLGPHGLRLTNVAGLEGLAGRPLSITRRSSTLEIAKDPSSFSSTITS